MILFIYGASSIGKTTFLKSAQHDLVPPSDAELVVVYADHCEEHHWVGEEFICIKKKKKWGGKRAEKRPMYHLDNMIGDDSMMWVVEAMRYPNGLWMELVRAHELSNGGLRVIVPYYSGEVGLYFRQHRCDAIGKKLSAYWTVDNCQSESDYRVNFCKKHLVSAGIPCKFVSIGKYRKEWLDVKVVLYSWLYDAIDGGWYK